MIQMSVFTVQQILLNILQHFLYPLQRMFFNFFFNKIELENVSNFIELYPIY